MRGHREVTLPITIKIIDYLFNSFDQKHEPSDEQEEQEEAEQVRSGQDPLLTRTKQVRSRSTTDH